MNKKWVLAAGAAIVVLAGGGYWTYDYFTGNQVEIKEVIGETEAAAASGAVVTSEQLNGEWTIADGSEVYISMTTSKETVNMTAGTVTGKWTIDTASAGQMTAEGVVDLAGLDSGNPMRDGHIKGDQYLNAEAHPQAKFAATSIDGFPETWSEGVAVPLQLKGTLNVRGVDKEVVFDSQAVYEQGQVKLEGSTIVTFADFGMKNPHQVIVETENDVKVELRLLLDKPAV
ncbi:YceI family protein [Paenibacillus xanthanilyticus]|uniref:YceI family protein n=1 Tax=Paenibacillus xanthanilyticus TaxID=1783531 RepID=A0ABV8K2U6_9BACL